MKISKLERGHLARKKCGVEPECGQDARAPKAAEIDLLERRVVTIPADKWEQFEAWANAPAKIVPALRKLRYS